MSNKENRGKLNKPFVSVCMITYNHGPYVKNAICSILAQRTNFSIELVVSDDRSLDNTQVIINELIKEFSKEYCIKYIRHSYNIGIADNFIHALRYCSGKYIAICEGDDYWIDAGKLQRQVDFLESNPEYGLVASDIIIVNQEGVEIENHSKRLNDQRASYKPDVDVFDLLRRNSINTLTVCVRAEIIKKLTDRCSRDRIWYIYDYWFWLHIAINHKIHISSKRTAAYRLHEGNVSRSSDFIAKRKHLVQLDVLRRLHNMGCLAGNKVPEVIVKTTFEIFRSSSISILRKLIIVRILLLHPYLLWRTIGLSVKAVRYALSDHEAESQY